MLRRHSTKSKSDLKRRKSTISVRSVQLKHINVAEAQRDAHLAATQAFSRGQERLSAEMALFPPPASPTRDRGSPGKATRNDSVDSRASEHTGQGLSRRQSVRFVGPGCSLQTRPSRSSMRTVIVSRDENTPRHSIYRSKSSQNVGNSVHPVLRHTENLQLPDRTSSRGKALLTPQSGIKEDYLQVLAPEIKKYTPEDDIASLPSSYRRIRKSRSMLTPGSSARDGTNTSTNGNQYSSMFSSASTNQTQQVVPASTMSRYAPLNRKENDSRPTTPTLRAPKSMSFLRNRRDHAGLAPSRSMRETRAASVHIPGTQLQDTSLRSRIMTKPSMFFGSKNKRPEPGTAMRKTLRNSSLDGVIPTSATSPSIPWSNHGSLRGKARKVSTSLKSKLKSLFGNSKSEDDTKMPAQQIEAQRTHVSENFDENYYGSNASESGGYPVRGSLSQVSSKVPSLRAIPSNERIRSRRGSMESFKSGIRKISGEKSRVTSWASTDVNTVVTHHAQEGSEDWERQRLSVIKENGAHAPSPSINRPHHGLHTIVSDEDLAEAALGQPNPTGPTVDSQRIYSALMKRMNDTTQLANIIQQQRKSSGATLDHFRTMSPASSIDSRASNDHSTQLTPNCGQPHNEHFQHASTDHFTAKIYQQPVWDDAKIQKENTHGCPHSTSATTKSSYKAFPSPVPGDGQGLSPPIHLSPRFDDTTAPKVVSNRTSAFFGSPNSHLFRTQSPFRRSLQEAMRARTDGNETCANTLDGGNGSFDSARPHRSSMTSKLASNETCSESNYSDATEDRQSEVNPQFPVDELSDNPETFGDASVLVSSPVYRPTREVSSASSVEWKACLSAKVAKLESPSTATRVSGRPSEVEYALPTMPKSFGHGHVREHAETGSYDEDEYTTSPVARMPTNPTTPLSAIEPNVIKLSPQQRSVLRTTPPSESLRREQGPPPSYEKVATAPSHPPPPVPVRSSLRPMPSPLNNRQSSRDLRTAYETQPQTHVQATASTGRIKSLARLQNPNGVRTTETGSPHPAPSATVRLLRKTGNKIDPNGTLSAISSPAFSSAFERQFGVMSRCVGPEHVEKENQSPREADVRERNDTQADDDLSPGKKSQVKGSRTMVDLFLNSRRRRMTDDDSTVFI